MNTVILALLAQNAIGVVVCHAVAKSRVPTKVIFWTTLGLIFGVLAIPFVFGVAQRSQSRLNLQ